MRPTVVHNALLDPSRLSLPACLGRALALTCRWLYADGTRGTTIGNMAITDGTYACPTMDFEFTMPMSWQITTDRIMLVQRYGYQADQAGNLPPGYPAVASYWMDLWRIPWTHTSFWILGWAK